MKRRRPDPVTVVAGVAITGLGVLTLLDQLSVLQLRFDYGVPAILATAGIILLVSGLNR